MNVKVISVKDMDGKNVKLQEFVFMMFNHIGYIKDVNIGECLILYDNNARTICHRSTPVQNVTYSEDGKRFEVETLNYTYEFEILDDGKKRKATATLYTHVRFHNRLREDTRNPDGYLYAYGHYRTKIFPSDLPEWYVRGYMYKTQGYMSAKGVKHLYYKPNYVFDNHLYKYDTLFISYDEPITPTVSENCFNWFEGYKHVLDGSTMVDFLDAVEKYSNYDVSEIRKEFEKKEKWYYERHPENKR